MLKAIENGLREEDPKMEKYFSQFKEPMINEKGVSYCDHERGTMDIFYPDPYHTKLPVIIEFHGGALISCSTKSSSWICRYLADQGNLVFNIEYPFLFDYDNYEIISFISQALPVIEEKIKALNGDYDKVFIMGDSAGGYLATYLTAILNDPSIHDYFKAPVTFLKAKALLTISAMFYINKIDSSKLFMLKGLFLKKHDLKPYEHISKLAHAIPQVLMLTAKKDYLRKYSLNASKVFKNVTLIDDPREYEHDWVCFHPDTPEMYEALDKIQNYIHNI